jgi:hypothetical protein
MRLGYARFIEHPLGVIYHMQRLAGVLIRRPHIHRGTPWLLQPSVRSRLRGRGRAGMIIIVAFLWAALRWFVVREAAARFTSP